MDQPHIEKNKSPLFRSEFFLYVAVIILLILVLAYFSNPTTDIYKKYLYFDYNGTTPPHRSVVRKVAESSWLGNPSGVYAKQAKLAMEEARYSIARWLSSNHQMESPEQFLNDNYIIFNSGASEGNNHVIRGLVDKFGMSASNIPNAPNAPNAHPHIVMSSVEHKTSIDCAKRMKELGLADVTFVDPSADGRLDPASIGSAINDRTILISVMHYNNETGAINNIAEIGRAVKLVSTLQDRYIVYHVDAVQSFGKTPIPMNALGIDALTMSFHKIYGPSGIGFLALNRAMVDSTGLGTQIAGTQNYKLRGGTENTAAVAAIPDTMRITMGHRNTKNERLQAYKNYIIEALTNRFSLGDYAQYYGKSDDYDPFVNANQDLRLHYDIVFLGPTRNGLPDPENSAPNTLYFAIVKHAPLSKHFCNINFRDSLFEEHRVIASIGSACSAGSGGGSHVLTAIKAPYIIRCGVIRISFGDPTTWKQVHALRQALICCIEKQN